LRSTARADAGRGGGPTTLPAAVALISLAGALLLLTYPFLVRWSAERGLPNAALIAWSALFGAWGLRHPRARWGWLAAALLLLAAATLELTPVWLAYAPPVLINLALAVSFGATLLSGREPIISRIARTERGVLEPDLAMYTRRLTFIWTVFFVAMAMVCAILVSYGLERAWAWFTGVGNYLLVAALFVGEWIYRQRRFAHYRHANPFELIRLVCLTMTRRQ
jgi:uncharacterized membrane protein